MTANAFTNATIAFTEKKMDMALDDIIKMSKPNMSKVKNQRTSNRSRKPFSGTQNKSLKVRQYMDSRSSLRQGVLAQRRTSFQENRFPLASEAAKKAVVAPFRNRGFLNRNRTANWNRPRAGAPMGQWGNGPTSMRQQAYGPTSMRQQAYGPTQMRQRGRVATGGGFAMKSRLQQQQQPRPQPQPQQQTKPKTLDSLFANIMEQRMRSTHLANNFGNREAGQFHPRQPWGRGQRYRN